MAAAADTVETRLDSVETLAKLCGNNNNNNHNKRRWRGTHAGTAFGWRKKFCNARGRHAGDDDDDDKAGRTMPQIDI